MLLFVESETFSACSSANRDDKASLALYLFLRDIKYSIIRPRLFLALPLQLYLFTNRDTDAS